jgi:hypothetical protein
MKTEKQLLEEVELAKQLLIKAENELQALKRSNSLENVIGKNAVGYYCPKNQPRQKWSIMIFGEHVCKAKSRTQVIRIVNLLDEISKHYTELEWKTFKTK